MNITPDPERKSAAELSLTPSIEPSVNNGIPMDSIISIFERAKKGCSDEQTKELDGYFAKHIKPFEKDWNQGRVKVLFKKVFQLANDYKGKKNPWKAIFQSLLENYRKLPFQLQADIHDRFVERELSQIHQFYVQRGNFKQFSLTSLGKSLNPVAHLVPPSFMKKEHFRFYFKQELRQALDKGVNNYIQKIEEMTKALNFLLGNLEKINDQKELKEVVENLRKYLSGKVREQGFFSFLKTLAFDSSMDKKDSDLQKRVDLQNEIKKLGREAQEKIQKDKKAHLEELEKFFIHAKLKKTKSEEPAKEKQAKKKIASAEAERKFESDSESSTSSEEIADEVELSFGQIYMQILAEHSDPENPIMHWEELILQFDKFAVRKLSLWQAVIDQQANTAYENTLHELLLKPTTKNLLKPGDPDCTQLHDEIEAFWEVQKEPYDLEELANAVSQKRKEEKAAKRCVVHYTVLFDHLQQALANYERARKSYEEALGEAIGYYEKEEIIQNLKSQQIKADILQAKNLQNIVDEQVRNAFFEAEQQLQKEKHKLLKAGDPAIVQLCDALKKFGEAQPKPWDLDQLTAAAAKKLGEEKAAGRCAVHFALLLQHLEQSQKNYEAALKEGFKVASPSLATLSADILSAPLFVTEREARDIFKLTKKAFDALKLTEYMNPQEMVSQDTDKIAQRLIKKALNERPQRAFTLENYAFKLGGENMRELLADGLIGLLGYKKINLKKHPQLFRNLVLTGARGGTEFEEPDGIASVWIRTPAPQVGLAEYTSTKQRIARVQFELELCKEDKAKFETLSAELEQLNAKLKQCQQNVFDYELNLIKENYEQQLKKLESVLKSTPKPSETLIKEREKLLKEIETLNKQLFAQTRANLIGSIQAHGVVDSILGNIDGHSGQYVILSNGVVVCYDYARFGFPFSAYYVLNNGKKEVYACFRSSMFDHPAAAVPLDQENIAIIQAWDLIEIKEKLKKMAGNEAVFNKFNNLLNTSLCLDLLKRCFAGSMEFGKNVKYADFKKKILKDLKNFENSNDRDLLNLVAQIKNVFEHDPRKPCAPMEEMFNYCCNKGNRRTDQAMKILEEEISKLKAECFPYIHPLAVNTIYRRIEGAQQYVNKCFKEGSPATVEGLFHEIYPEFTLFVKALNRVGLVYDTGVPMGPGIGLAFFPGGKTYGSLNYILELIERNKAATESELEAMRQMISTLEQQPLLSSLEHHFLH